MRELPKPPPWLIFKELLGTGGMGQVLAAEDTRTSERIAVKTLSRFSSKELLCLKNEFRSCSAVMHPNLVAQHELVEFDGQWFLLMELVDGKPLFAWATGRSLRNAAATPAAQSTTQEADTTTQAISLPSPASTPPAPLPSPPQPGQVPPPDLGRLLPVLAQLARGLDAIHKSGYLHRDLKPANVVVTTDGVPKLLDFGIAIARQAAQRESGGDTTVVGTPAYIAPELLTGAPATAASDWYSFGCVAFELLTERRPFVGTPSEVFEWKLSVEAPRASDFVEGIPAWLDDLVAGLLSRRPERRPGFEELSRALGPSGQEEAPTSAPASAHSAVVGREAELRRLLVQASKAIDGPQAIFVTGRSGVGKSALLADAIGRMRTAGALVLEGRCYEQEQVPYKTVDKLVDAFADEAERKPAWLEAVLPEDRLALGAAFPVLRDVLGLEPTAHVDSGEDPANLRRRALGALTELFSALAKRVRLVCVVDDLQWGDTAGLQVLAGLLRPASPGIFVVLAYRAEDRDAPVVAAAREAVRHASGVAPETLSLEPLSERDSRRLAQVLAVEAGVRESALVEWAHRESRGEPFLLHELLFVAASDPSVATGHQGLTLADVIQFRVERLAPPARALLHSVCLAGHAVPLWVAHEAADTQALAQAQRELKAAHFIRTSQLQGELHVDTYHDKLREVVSAKLPEASARRLHARLGRAWELAAEATGISVRRFAIARHFGLAGDEVPAPDRIRAHVDAAHEASAAFESAKARVLAADARAIARQAQLPFAEEDELLLGDASLASHDVDEAKGCFDALVRRAQSPRVLANAHYGLARLAIMQIDTATTLAECNLALQFLGQTQVLHRPTNYLGALFSFFTAYLRSAVTKRTAVERPADALAAQLYSMAGYAAYFLMSKPLVVQAVLRGYEHVKRLGARRDATKWYAFASVLAALARKLPLARRLSLTAETIAEQVRDPCALGTVASINAMALDMAGDPLGAHQRMRQGLTQYGKWIELPEFLTAVASHSWNLLMRGYPRQAWVATQEGMARIGEADDSLMSRGHTFRCYAGPELAMLGLPAEGLAHLDEFQKLLAKHAATDRWRNLQLLSHRALALQLARAGDAELEDTFERQRAYGLKPSAHPHQLRQFFVAKALRRLDQAESRPGEASSLRRAEQAVGELRSIAAHPTLGLHLQVCEARLAVLRGKATDVLFRDLFERALALDSPWPAAEAAKHAAAWCRSQKRADEAERWAKEAKRLWEAHELRALQ